jgi:phosphoserine phosphatase RsbU/P
MSAIFESGTRLKLIDRRRNLEHAISRTPNAYLTGLLQEVDAALSRLDSGTFGICETCREPIEREMLSADPLVCFCIDHLTEPQQRALEQDLQLASHIQSALLPPREFSHAGWKAAYHYEPAGLVSGDYCDLITAGGDSFYFMIGDVSGKGVGSAMLMSHLHAMFRALLTVPLPLVQIMERASRVFCESTHSNQYATLVCGRANQAGEIELCNAGHLPSLLLHKQGCRDLNSNGLPLGLFCSEEFSTDSVKLFKGDLLILFTDGLSESQAPSGAELGVPSLIEWAKNRVANSAREFTQLLLKKASQFRSGTPPKDDLTILAIERTD